MKKKRNLLYIIIGIILGSIAISLVDGVIRPEYLIKSISKIAVFPVIFAVYYIIFNNERPHLKIMFSFKKKALLTAAALGIGVFAVVMGAFFLFRNIIDFSVFTDNLTSTAGLDTSNFVFVSIYICIINSFMEELFFRALGFLTLKRVSSRGFAYGFSAIMFALYHTGMTAAFVAPWVFILMLIGLFLGGIIFSYVDEKTESIFPSWLCHLFANLATTSIGFILLSGN